MGKTIPILLLIAAAAAAWASPAAVVDQNFNGSQFPPPGWAAEGEGEGEWRWTNPGGYVRGYSQPYPYENLDMVLKSPDFAVGARTRLHVRFRYYITYTVVAADMFANIGSWELYLPLAETWTWVEEDTPVYEGRASLHAEWRIRNSGGSYHNDATFFLDDVRISRYNAGADPASLGRVKALFR